MTAILCVIFFLSGASSLIFEILWFQLSGLAFGNSIIATSIVLSSFMGGLALGNFLIGLKGYKIKFPVRLYAYLEIIIGISGFCLVLLLPKLTLLFVPLFRAFLDQPFLLNSLRGFFAFSLMLIPATGIKWHRQSLHSGVFSIDIQSSFGRRHRYLLAAGLSTQGFGSKIHTQRILQRF